MATTKARSRLKVETISNKKEKKKKLETKLLPKKIQIKEHLRYSVLLILSILSFYLLFLLTKNFYPQEIQNFIFPNSYLAFFTLLFAACFFLFTFIFLNKKIGLILSFLINLSFYFKFLAVSFNIISFITIVVLTLILIFTVYLNFSKNKKESNL